MSNGTIFAGKTRNYDYPKGFYESAARESYRQKIVELILKHEGLLENQTPFRITNEKMRLWNTIHGFEIDRGFVAPKSRRNFIFLKNKEDVPKAVRAQFVSYLRNPGRYSLTGVPSLEDAVRKFDATGSEGKINYLKKNGINTAMTLKEIFGE